MNDGRRLLVERVIKLNPELRSEDIIKYITSNQERLIKYFQRYVPKHTVSTATLEQKKADKKYLTELVAIKLKVIKEIKENPELLKHLKISTVTYVPTGAHVVVEWKEGFVYSDL